MNQLDFDIINASQAKPKTISPWLNAAADIQIKYFGQNPTTLTLQEVRDEIIQTYHELPLLEVAMILMVVDSSYKKLQEQLETA